MNNFSFDGNGGAGGGGRYVTSTSSDTDLNQKVEGSHLKKNSKIKLNNHRLFSRQPNNQCQKIIHMNKSESLIKLNKCLNDITSLSSSASSCDLNDNKQTRSKWSKTSRGCSNRKCLILLCFISFFFNPLFGKFEILISFDNINSFKMFLNRNF